MLGKLRQARRLADQLRHHDLHDYRCYQRLVEFYVISNDTASARRILSETETEVEPRYRPYMYFVAGRQAHLKGRSELRDYYARKAISLSPDSSRMLARCWYLMNDLDKALATYEMALSKDSTDNQLYAEMGVIYARKKDNAQAQQMIDQMQSMKPKYDFGYTPYCQGRIAANMGDRDRALKYLKQALDEGVKFRASIEFLEDPDLAMLRDDQEYKQLLKRI
jgi:tetratricopeptide (TPR) repeat protein